VVDELCKPKIVLAAFINARPQLVIQLPTTHLDSAEGRLEFGLM
jgi:hypothetical protein